jgi:diacylglycerol kinase family enzyme
MTRQHDRTQRRTDEPLPRGVRWLAFAAILAMLAAVVVLLVGGLKSILVLLTAVVAIAVSLAGAWWFVSRLGLMRWVGAALMIGAPCVVLVVYIVRDVLWAVIVVLALIAISVALGRAALTRLHPVQPTPEHPAQPTRRPFLIMNPRSGGGKVGRFDLVAKSRARGADVELLEGPGQVDVASLAEQAVADGHDLLGVAGGDGTQALVAGIAATHDLPFLVISAGTRNHFAMDLGLDREHPDACLDALTDPVELCIDLGEINGRTFVNNASFGAYAEVVRSPEYRDDKRGTTLRLLPAVLSGQAGAHLTAYVDGELVARDPKAVLVSNNPYLLNDLAGLGSRPRLDGGVLGVVAMTVDSAAHAVRLMNGSRSDGLVQCTAHEVVIDADTDEIPVGIDGESVMLQAPVRCTVRAHALRVRVPQGRTLPALKAPFDARSVLRAALTRV